MRSSFIRLLITLSVSVMTSGVFAQSGPVASNIEMPEMHYSQIPSNSRQVLYFATMLNASDFAGKKLFSAQPITQMNSKIVHIHAKMRLQIPLDQVKDKKMWTYENMKKLAPTSDFVVNNKGVTAYYKVDEYAAVFLKSNTISCQYEQRLEINEIPMSATDSLVYLTEQTLPQQAEFIVVQYCKNYSEAFVESLQVLRFYRLQGNQTLMSIKSLMSVNPSFYSAVNLVPFITPWKEVRDSFLKESYSLKSALERGLQ